MIPSMRKNKSGLIMKMYYSMRLQGIISMLALFLSFSCSYEKEGRKPEFPYGVVDVNFSVRMKPSFRDAGL